MSVILGIDIGGSTTKIVGLRPDGSPIAMRRVQAQDPSPASTALSAAFCSPTVWPWPT